MFCSPQIFGLCQSLRVGLFFLALLWSGSAKKSSILACRKDTLLHSRCHAHSPLRARQPWPRRSPSSLRKSPGGIPARVANPSPAPALSTQSQDASASARDPLPPWTLDKRAGRSSARPAQRPARATSGPGTRSDFVQSLSRPWAERGGLAPARRRMRPTKAAWESARGGSSSGAAVSAPGRGLLLSQRPWTPGTTASASGQQLQSDAAYGAQDAGPAARDEVRELVVNERLKTSRSRGSVQPVSGLWRVVVWPRG